MSDRETIQVSSAYEFTSRKPGVAVAFMGERIILPPEEAQGLALNLLQAAEASFTDSFLMTFLTERAGLKPDVAHGLLNDYRAFRAARRERT